MDRFFTIKLDFSDRYWRGDYEDIVSELMKKLMFDGYKFRVSQETTNETGTCTFEIIRED